MTAPAEDSAYMTVKEFAHLPGAAQIAVWQAAETGRVNFIWTGGAPHSGIRRYHRAQVLEVLQEEGVSAR